jgi:hypothetical protein
VDYEVPLEAVARNFAAAFTNTNWGIQLLRFAGQDLHLPKLPSWIPLWTGSSNPPPIRDLHTFSTQLERREKRGDSRLTFALSDENNTLMIMGTLSDFVFAICDSSHQEAIRFMKDFKTAAGLELEFQDLVVFQSYYGFMGISTKSTRIGDLLCSFNGSAAKFLIERSSKSGHYWLITGPHIECANKGVFTWKGIEEFYQIPRRYFEQSTLNVRSVKELKSLIGDPDKERQISIH